MWYSCRMHLYRRGNTIDRGVDTDGRAGGAVGIGFRNGNTTIAGIGVAESYTCVAESYTCGGSVGIRHGSGSITRHESRIYLDDEYVIMTRKYFLEYTQLEILEFCDTLIQHMESVKKSVDERAQHKREYDSRVNERQMHTTEEKVETSNALDASLVNTENIRPIYDEEPMAEVQLPAENNVFATRQQHSEQPEFNNEGEVDQNAEQCHDKCPLHAKLTNNQITGLSYQSLESENICLKKTVAKFQKVFSRMEAHCVNLELKYQNQALKEGQHGQFLKVDVIETINIELEHKVAKLLKENETLKRHYKELSDSIKTTRAKTIEHKTSFIAKNTEFKAQLQDKGFAIAALKNKLRKLTINSVNTKFAKSSILRKPVLQRHRNQSVVRQPTAFKSERPRILKPREREYAFAKLQHMIAPSSSRYSLNDMVHNHYLEEAKKKIQERGRNSRPSVMPSAGSQSTTSGKIFESSTTKVDSEPPHGSNTNITTLQECIQTLDSSAGTSINVQEEQNLDLSAGTPLNLKKDRIKTWTKDNVISRRPRLHGIASLQEISARPSS
ncbi:hypothetical protein Tco_1483689 [Tanacetum coccineum]